jgi:tetratricopeptide (TPR) repeat protein
VSSWEALIRCLYYGEFFNEALEQVKAAQKMTDYKPIFYFYLSAVYMSLGKLKEALLHLEKGMEVAPRQLRKMVELDPSVLQHQQAVDIIARFKRNKSI